MLPGPKFRSVSSRIDNRNDSGTRTGNRDVARMSCVAEWLDPFQIDDEQGNVGHLNGSTNLEPKKYYVNTICTIVLNQHKGSGYTG